MACDSSKSFAFYPGETISISIPTPWDLTGYTVSSELRDGYGTGNLAATFTVGVTTAAGKSTIALSLSSAQTAALTQEKPDYAFNVKLVAPGGSVQKTSYAGLLIKRGAV